MPRKLNYQSAWLAALFLTLGVALVRAQQPVKTLPSETPPKFQPTNEGFEYTRRDMMIPMRDGVKLHTVILVPKGATPSMPASKRRCTWAASRG